MNILAEIGVGPTEIALAGVVLTWAGREALKWLKTKQGIDLKGVTDRTESTDGKVTVIVEDVSAMKVEIEKTTQYLRSVKEETRDIIMAQAKLNEGLTEYKQTMSQIQDAVKSGDFAQVKLLVEGVEKSIEKSIESLEKQMNKLCDINDKQASIFNDMLREINSLNSSMSSMHKRFDDISKNINK